MQLQFIRDFIINISNKTKRHHTLVLNFGYLSALKVFLLLVPLITLPYLIRILGKETYGLIVFAQAIITYLVTLINFGFNISATKEISVHRTNKKKLSEIVSSVYIAKGIAFLLSCLILALLYVFIPKIKENILLFELTMFLCLFEWLFPIWYFQGVERMKHITLINLVSRSIFLILIFILIKEETHFLRVPMINGIGSMVASFTALYIVFFKDRIKFNWQSLNTIKTYIRESVPFFIANISTQLYTNTNKVILGFYGTMSGVAYYDLAEKIASLLRTPLNLIGQSAFPKNAKDKDIRFIKKLMVLTFIITLLLLLVVAVFSEKIVLIIGGIDMMEAVNITRLYLLTILPISISHFLGYQTLVIFGYKKYFLRVIISAFFFYAFSLGLIIIFSTITVYSLIFIIILVRLYILVGMYYFCKKFKLL